MIGVESRYLNEETTRQHVGVAVMAAVASLVFHVLLIVVLSKMDFSINSGSRITKRPKPKPFELAEVHREPLPDSRQAVLKPGDPLQPVNLPKQADVMGVPPDEVAVEPPVLPEDKLAGELGIIAEPSATPQRAVWEPRQEILKVENQVVADRPDSLGRKIIPRLDRVNQAPDFVFPVERDKMEPEGTPIEGREFGADRLTRLDVAGGAKGGGEGWGRRARSASLLVDQPRSNLPPDIVKAVEAEGKDFKAIEKFLTADITTYTSLTDLAYGYFRIEIRRVGPDILPVIPKDVLLVQDCSASMTDQRLHFCTNGLVLCLSEIGPQDRFNVVSFRDKVDMCFPQWAPNTPENIEKANRYVGEIKSSGNTDIYQSLKELVSVNPVPGRPVIAVLLSDGYPTMGVVRSADIIGEFSKLNNGQISVFSMGTIQTANSYLLEQLSYCNRGDSFIVTSGRWGIPASAQNLAREVSRPVLSDVKFFFGGGSSIEVFPVLTSNLYLDRSLVLFGRYRRGTENVVFQAIGKAGNVDCDMVFNLSLTTAASGGKEIRTDWAKQKIYHLIGQYARRTDPVVMKDIQDTAKSYRVEVPYRGKLDR